MSIVPAGMHLAVNSRAILDFVQFIYRERVHVGANGNSFCSRPTCASAQQPDNARFSNARLYLQSQSTQTLRHNAGGAHLFKGEFGMFVQVATHRHHIGNEFINFGFQLISLGHEASWSLAMQQFSARTHGKKPVSPTRKWVLVSPGFIVTCQGFTQSIYPSATVKP